MNALNLSPLFRTAIGFDRLARMIDTAQAADVSYPPYNLERTGEDAYRLTMAVAGFGPDDIEITAKELKKRGSVSKVQRSRTHRIQSLNFLVRLCALRALVVNLYEDRSGGSLTRRYLWPTADSP